MNQQFDNDNDMYTHGLLWTSRDGQSDMTGPCLVTPTEKESTKAEEEFLMELLDQCATPEEKAAIRAGSLSWVSFSPTKHAE